MTKSPPPGGPARAACSPDDSADDAARRWLAALLAHGERASSAPQATPGPAGAEVRPHAPAAAAG